MLTFLTLCAAAAPAPAQTLQPAPGAPGIDGLSVSGFGTVGVVRTNTNAAQLVRYNQRTGATRDPDASVDSILGFQASYRSSAALSATVQALVRKSIDGNYRPQLAWAFVRYQAGDGVSVRVGRLAAPGYLLADSQNVGYLSTAMRPSPEVYGISQLTHVDGADLIWQRGVGAWTVSAQLIAGYNRATISADTASRERIAIGTHIRGLSLTLEDGPLLLRAGRIRADIAVPDLAGLPKLWSALAASGYPRLGPQLSLMDSKRFDFTSVGMTYDAARLTLQAEYVTRQAAEPSYLADTAAWYVLAGYRFGAWLPYVQHARVRQTGAGLTRPAGFPATGALAQAVRYDLMTAPAQHSDTLGLRWNMALGRSLTVQLDRLRPTAKSGTLIGGPAAGLKTPVMVLGLSFDFVY
jgi:hypothetical protein